MSKYIDEIINLIEMQSNKADNISIIRLEGFENPIIYMEICKYFKLSTKINLEAKLSRERYLEFKEANNYNWILALRNLEDNHFIDDEGTMTRLRNKSTELRKEDDIKNLVILMGTELVEDKGGLADFYKITPEIILKLVKKNYSAWFNDIIPEVSTDKDIKKAINTFFKVLFKNINVNLLSLSELVDELDKINIGTADDLFEEVCFRLSNKWGIPNIIDTKKIPKTRDLKSEKIKSAEILEKAYKFINRVQFNKGLSNSKLKNYIGKIDKYAEEEGIDLDLKFPIDTEIFNNYNEFKDSLLDFIMGKNNYELKKKFLELDFAIVDKVLNIKLPDTNTNPKEKENKLFGEPIEVYSEMILKVIYDYKRDYKELPKDIEIKLNSIKITNCIEEEKELLKNRINLRLCGILNYLEDYEEIKIKYIGEIDPFSLEECRDFDVTTTNNINELSKINFTVVAKNKEENYSRKRDYTYCFSNLDPWFNDYILLEEDLLSKEIDDTIIPLYSECSNINQYINCEVEEEFFIKLQKIKIKKISNEIINDLSIIDNTSIISEFALLRDDYKNFIKEFNLKGIYNTFTENSICKKVFNRYSNLLKITRENYQNLTSTQKKMVNLILNIFLIADKNYTDFKNLKSNIIMMPPYHPIMLEKFYYKNEHIKNSFFELIEQIQVGNILKESELDKRLDYTYKMNEINSGFDIYSFNEQSSLKLDEVYGRYAIYNLLEDELNIITDNTVRNDLLELEEYDSKCIKKKSHKSEIISQNIIDYVNTFPARADGINLLFINPDEMQHIVAGVNAALDFFSLRNLRININIRILVSTERRSGQEYLKYWLNIHEQLDSDSKVKTYLNYVDIGSSQLYEQITKYINNQDLTYIYNILENVSIDFMLSCLSVQDNSIKYPAIYTPMPVSISQDIRAIDISQRQFNSCSEHVQLMHKILRPNEIEGLYRVVKKMEIKDIQREILQKIHNESKWVICLDETIDKNILNSEESKIIGFSTGKGLFGELNTTVSARIDVLEDLQEKLKKKLLSKFHKWLPDIANKAAYNCIEISKNLDGSKMLKALNPKNTEIHNYLAYVMTMQAININGNQEKNLIKVLLNLDNYLHWFDDYLVNDYTNENKIRPDFLVLEILKNDDIFDINKPLMIKATVIECKMTKENDYYIEEAIKQVKTGIEKLANKFNPLNRSVNRRYWFNQLYRSLVFSKVNMNDNEEGYDIFIDKLSGILDGNFKIEWNGKIYAYWLDVNDSKLNRYLIYIEELNKYNINTLEVYTAGQLFIQKLLLPEDVRDEVEIEFSLEEKNEDKDFIENILLFDTENDYVDYHQEDENTKKILPNIHNKNENKNIEEDVAAKEEVIFTKINENNASNPDEKISKDIDQITNKKEIIVSEKTDSNNIKLKEDIRFLLGEDLRTKEKVYWEYMNKELNNRHLLINGNSGSGKTYCIQTLILEAVKNDISVIVFDYTDGFTKSKLSPILLNELGENFEERYVKYEKFPINPFKRRQVEFNGKEFTEPEVDVANRIASSFKNVYKFGPQQRNTVYSAVLEGIKQYGDNMTLEILAERLLELNDNTASTTLSKIRPLVDYNPFDTNKDFSWESIINKKGEMYVIQLSGFDREIQLILTDLILWDIWNYAVMKGSEATPIPIVLDEAQNLSHSEDTPSGKILAEGRKFGISGWYATQFMKGRLTSGEIGNLQQAAQKLYFSPPEESILEVAKYIDITSDGSKIWAEKLSKLIKGQCVSSGYKFNNGRFDKYQPKTIKITSLEDRINE